MLYYNKEFQPLDSDLKDTRCAIEDSIKISKIITSHFWNRNSQKLKLFVHIYNSIRPPLNKFQNHDEPRHRFVSCSIINQPDRVVSWFSITFRNIETLMSEAYRTRCRVFDSKSGAHLSSVDGGGACRKLLILVKLFRKFVKVSPEFRRFSWSGCDACTS